jgi:hypothetical protein
MVIILYQKGFSGGCAIYLDKAITVFSGAVKKIYAGAGRAAITKKLPCHFSPETAVFSKVR